MSWIMRLTSYLLEDYPLRSHFQTPIENLYASCPRGYSL